ncbi:putative leucine-rich repeat protein (LRRP) [Trypanosoma rangeli]|uniref:Putative leucine-rich repeat protein (LRRP) n=1 Tax=Trypanosoma rangeli TaxID=5698 RepID=A0A422N524_TRYRA|nr:putative leucine-rich repeat protein (LRRP) [Trypanosoma rangeli]RNF00569.1 putative leucine-rich repeat protein (LRRP) [Trypanosoma rangeli]|eukprot:RNF00569.1 putative leucine-rich repeat protein (LRRP) [Trypanosoma rangeli]
MIVPAPWDADTPCEFPPAPGGTSDDLFWGIVRTYTGHSCESLRLLCEGGVALSSSLHSGSACLHDAVRPIVPPQLLKAGVIPPIIPLEDLPEIDCCEDVTAITKLRAHCFRYGESVSRLLEIAKECAGRWGRLRENERKRLSAALANERAARMWNDELHGCFTDLILSGKGLRQVTEGVTRFSNLTTLVLSNNPKLLSIPYLPPACLVLVACGCSIREVCASRTLTFLGLPYNMVEQLDFLEGMPELRVLDLTRNAVFCIEAAVQALRGRPLLEDVTFTGCPIALLDDYVERMVAGCPRLRLLDHSATDGLAKLHPEANSKTSEVVLRVEVAKLEGLTALTHTLVQREESPSAIHAEAKASKGKKRPEPFPRVPCTSAPQASVFKARGAVKVAMTRMLVVGIVLGVSFLYHVTTFV